MTLIDGRRACGPRNEERATGAVLSCFSKYVTPYRLATAQTKVAHGRSQSCLEGSNPKSVGSAARVPREKERGSETQQFIYVGLLGHDPRKIEGRSSSGT